MGRKKARSEQNKILRNEIALINAARTSSLDEETNIKTRREKLFKGFLNWQLHLLTGQVRKNRIKLE